jgi:hypothetical protein
MFTLRIALLIATCSLGLWQIFEPTWTSRFALLQPDPGDVSLNHYFLEHSYRWAFDSSYPCSFWSPNFFYPTPKVLTYSETLIGVAPLYWGLRFCFPEILSLQLFLMLVLTLNFISAAIVARWFRLNIFFTATIAYLFAFGILRYSHLTQIHLLPEFFSPFAIWHAWGFLRKPSLRRWNILLALVTVQIFASLHLGWFVGFTLVIFGLWTVALQPRVIKRLFLFFKQNWLRSAIPVLISGLLLGLYAANFYSENHDRRSIDDVFYFMPMPKGWATSPAGNYWNEWTNQFLADVESEKRLFQSGMLYVVLLVGIWYCCRERFPQRRFAMLSIATGLTVSFLITNWSYEFHPWRIIHLLVPGADAFRAIGRIAFLVYLLCGLGSFLALQDLFKKRIVNPWLRNGLMASISLVAVAESTCIKPISFDPQVDIYRPSDQFAEELKGADAAYILYDHKRAHYQHHITAMWAGLKANVPIMNGYSGTWPPDYPAIDANFTLEEMVARLGPDWEGTLRVLEWDKPGKYLDYRIEKGSNASTRYRLLNLPGQTN